MHVSARQKFTCFFPPSFRFFSPTIRLSDTFIFIVLVFMVYFILFSISSSLQPPFMCLLSIYLTTVFALVSLFCNNLFLYCCYFLSVLRRKTACSYSPADLFRSSCFPYCCDLSGPGRVQKYTEATERSSMDNWEWSRSAP